MKKHVSFFALLFAVSISSSFAADHVYECTRDDEGDDWTITVKEDGSLANFFDNDHDTAMVNVRTIENKSTRAKIYSFEGSDGASASEFILNTGSLTGTLVDSVGTSDAYELAFTCTVEKEDPRYSVDWEAVQKAIDDAEQNGGSTRYPAFI